MYNNVLEYLDEVVKKVPNKLAYASETEQVTFQEVYTNSQKVATYLLNKGQYKQPIVVFMGKEPKTIISYYGVIATGGYYIPIDTEMPAGRIQLILDNVQASVIICDEKTKELAVEFKTEAEVVLYKEMLSTEIREQELQEVRRNAIDTDPIYIVFTSGSTGIPKGVVGMHRATIDYIENLSDVLGFNEETIFGNQTPLYLDACFKELYPTLKFGATTYLIPKLLFTQPVKLIEYLNEHKINTTCWVVSAFKMISTFKAFNTVVPKYLHTIAFGSEVFPIDQFTEWKRVLPNATYTNLYGPTECTGMSCYYRVNRELDLTDSIPIGIPFKNTEILLLDDNNKVVPKGEQGEICIRGTSLTHGYYNNPEKTAESFIQNPLNTAYPELIYKTGDIGKVNEFGELLFVSRKDYQIKHMGHRIELGEIEVNTNMLDGVDDVACIYDKNKQKIILFYAGKLEINKLKVELKNKLPRYMVPNVVTEVDKIPLTPNGKVNRMLLQDMYSNKKK